MFLSGLEPPTFRLTAERANLLLVWRSFKIFQEEIADITEQDHQIYFEFGPQDQNHLWYFWKCKHVMCTWQGQSAEIKPCF